MQRLLMPLILQLTPEQQIDYARIADELNASGFETEPFGNRTIAVKAAPANVGAAELEKILYEILEIAETELRGASLDDLRREYLRLHRLPRRHQDQHAPGHRQDGMAAARAGRDRLPHELPARPPHRHALLHARNPKGVPSHLTAYRGSSRSVFGNTRRCGSQRPNSALPDSFAGRAVTRALIGDRRLRGRNKSVERPPHSTVSDTQYKGDSSETIALAVQALDYFRRDGNRRTATAHV